MWVPNTTPEEARNSKIMYVESKPPPPPPRPPNPAQSCPVAIPFVLSLDLFNTELSPGRYRRGPRSQQDRVSGPTCPVLNCHEARSRGGRWSWTLKRAQHRSRGRRWNWTLKRAQHRSRGGRWSWTVSDGG